MVTTKAPSFFTLPALPLRDVVVYPHMVTPLFVGRRESINSLTYAAQGGKQLFLVTQKHIKKDQPLQDDVYEIGTLANILQVLRLPDGTVKLLVEGLKRAKQHRFYSENKSYFAEIELIELSPIGMDDQLNISMKKVIAKFEELARLNSKISNETLNSLQSIKVPDQLADSVAAHMMINIASRQKILETVNIEERLNKLYDALVEELNYLEMEGRIQVRIKNQVEKNQRQYYLNEKIKAIQHEMGEIDETGTYDEIKELEIKLKQSGMNDETLEKAKNELHKLKLMPPMAAEATVTRNYLEWLLNMPWKTSSKINKDLGKAASILDHDHYGLEKIKERILEYLAVQQRVKRLKGPILCLVGPPGVGKTSLGQSIAHATGRKFTRFSLGGVRDEAEIRGHRRTYVGSLPGKILQKLAKTKVKNPLFMLDEVDKMAMDFRGDPASALLEVLDPEQNNKFNDHYLEVDYDLSDIMFVATSNTMNVPDALLDRMEIIHLSGYTEKEKLNIAAQYLLPRQMKHNGLKADELKISHASTLEIIRSYTREAGVRNLEREIARICRKVVKEIVTKKTRSRHVTVKNLEHYLGVKRYRFGLAEQEDQIGQVTGLAWTKVGGEILTIEAQVLPGKGKSIYTGSLGDVMQESIQAAMTVVRSRSIIWGLCNDYFQKQDFHIHVPEGATPKDGPSAGIGMCVALVSAITHIPVKANVAMTGEITLRGEVLPIGGLKEKLLAALRGGIKTVIIPQENKHDLKEIPKDITQGLTIHCARWVDQVMELALRSLPEPQAIDAINHALQSQLIPPKGKGYESEASCH